MNKPTLTIPIGISYEINEINEIDNNNDNNDNKSGDIDLSDIINTLEYSSTDDDNEYPSSITGTSAVMNTDTGTGTDDDDEMNTDDLSSEYLKLHLHYSEIFIVKDLQRICDYYDINKRKLNKHELVNTIVLYELDVTNLLQVYTRKKLWFYISELNKNKYFKKFIIW